MFFCKACQHGNVILYHYSIYVFSHYTDPEMQHDIQTHVSAGQAVFNVLLLVGCSEFSYLLVFLIYWTILNSVCSPKLKFYQFEFSTERFFRSLGAGNSYFEKIHL